jgi:hypothetical protein
MTELFQIHDNIVDKEMMQLYYKWTMDSNSWFFGRQATLEDNRFWGQKLYERPGAGHFFVEYLEKKFKTVSSINFVTNSAALNGQTSNQQGGWHTDMDYTPTGEPNTSPPEKFLTLLYYVNPTWDDPRGSTILKTPDDKDLEIKFVPGRIAVFPSSWRHYGDCPAQDNLLRITCALKLEIIEDKV